MYPPDYKDAESQVLSRRHSNFTKLLLIRLKLGKWSKLQNQPNPSPRRIFFFLLCRSLLRLVINPQLLAAQKTATNAPKPLGEHGFLIMPACKADPNAISSFEAQRYHERHYDFRCADQRTNFFHNGVVDPSLVILHTFLSQNIAQNPADASQLFTNG